MTPRSVGYPQQAEKRSIVATIVFALLFIAWVGEWPVSVDTATYYGRWRSILGTVGPLFLPIPGISLNSWQLSMIVLTPLCMGAAATRWHAPDMDRAIIVGMTAVVVTCLWGLVMGGSPYFAYYQVWRIMLGLLVGYMLMSLLRTEADLALLGKVVVVAGLMRASACIYYYWTYLRGVDDPNREYVSNHDDSMIFVMAIQIAVVWAFLKGGKGAWTKAMFVVAVVLYAIVLNDRRIAWVELAFGVPLLYALIGPGKLRAQVNRVAIYLAPLVVAYVFAGTVSDHPIFAPVQAFTSAGSDSDASSLARGEEIRNLLRTLDDNGNPLLGTGWGRPYLFVERAYNNYDESWILAPYTPHNSLLGLAVFSGLVGMVCIWGVVPVAALLAARGYRRADSPVVKAAAMVAIGALCAYGVHCYGDIGLQSFPGAALFGAALGVAGRVSTWAPSAPTPDVATERVTSTRWTRPPQAAKPGPSIRPSSSNRDRN